MSVIKYIQRLRHIDFLLRTRATGNITCLAKKLTLSRSATLFLIKEMKDLGFPINYCKKRKCYYYMEDGKMTNSLFHKTIDVDGMRKINGGERFFELFEESSNNRLTNNNFTN